MNNIIYNYIPNITINKSNICAEFAFLNKPIDSLEITYSLIKYFTPKPKNQNVLNFIKNFLKTNKYQKYQFNKLSAQQSLWCIQNDTQPQVHCYCNLLHGLSSLTKEEFIDANNFLSLTITNIYQNSPELKTNIILLISLFRRTIKQFNTIEHNNTYHESILKQIVNTEYEKLQDIDKNQITDIINEFYNIEINQFDFIIYKTIQREFM